ncbi:hypothetical protein [Chryseobacterium sp.]|uniref:hypothetical protein n=1 Tax=Chryseobacterium sp. TaxID=1871047 RepID=UPI00388E11D3
MRNETKKSKKRQTLNRKAKQLKKIEEREEIYFTYQKFNNVFISVVTNLKDRQTHAYGKTKLIAAQNALENFRLKYGSY